MKNQAELIKFVEQLAKNGQMGKAKTLPADDGSIYFEIENGYATAGILVDGDKIQVELIRGKRDNVIDNINWSEDMPEYFSDCAKASKFLKVARTSIDTFIRLNK